MATLRLADLRHRVTLERPVREATEDGGAVLRFAPVATVWAHVEWQTSRTAEAVEARRRTGKVPAFVVLRWRPDVAAAVTSEWRVVIGGVPHALIGPATDPDGRRQQLHCLVERVDDASAAPVALLDGAPLDGVRVGEA